MSKRIIAAMGLIAVFVFSAWARQRSPSPLPQPSVNGQPEHKTKEPKQHPAPEEGVAHQTKPSANDTERGHAREKADANRSKTQEIHQRQGRSAVVTL